MADVSRLVINVTANTSRAIAGLTAVDARLRRLGSAGRTASTGMNGANNSMNRLSGSVRNGTTTLTRHTTTTTRATTATVTFGRAANSAGNSSSRMATMIHGAILSSIALSPVMQGATAAIGGLISAFASAGMAAGVFGLAVVASIKDPRIQASLEGVKAKFAAWGLDVAKYTRGPIVTAMNAVGASFTKLTPLVAAMSPVVQTLANAFARWVNTRLDSWVNFLIRVGVPMFQMFITIGRNVSATIGYLIRDFSGLGMGITRSLTQASASMRNWAANGGFKDFAATVRENAPLIKEFFRALGAAVANLGAAFMILGPHALRVVTILLQMVAAIPPNILAGLIAGFYALKAAMLVSTVVMIAWRSAVLIATATQLLLTSGTVAHAIATAAAMARVIAYRVAIVAITVAQKAWAAAQWLVNAALVANPIGIVIIAIAALVAIIVVIATKTTWFQTIWRVAWSGIQTAFFATWNFIKTAGVAIWNGLVVAFQATCNAFRTAWNAVGSGLATAWNAVWNAIRATGVAIWNGMVAIWRTVTSGFATAWNAVGGALSASWSAVWNGMRAIASTIWSAIGQVVQNSMQWISSTVSTILSGIGQIWSAGWNWVKNTASTIWNAIGQVVQNAFNWIRNTVSTILNAIGQIWQAGWNWVKNTASTIWNAIGQVVQNAFNWIRNTVSTILNAIGQIWQAGWNWIKNTASTIWNAIGQVVQNAFNWIRNTVRTILSAIGQVWQNGWNWIRETARTIWASMGQIIQNAINWIRSTIRTIIASIGQIWQNAWNWVRETARSIWAAMGQIIKNAFNWIRSTISSILSNIGQIWKNGWNWIANTAKGIWDWCKGKLDQFGIAVYNLIQNLVNKVKSKWNEMKEVFAKPIKWVIDVVFNKGLVPLWNNTAAKLPGLGEMKTMGGFATGGYTGNGGKYQPKGIVHGGEYVIKKSATQKIQKQSPGLLRHMNNTGSVPGYATGGAVNDGEGGLWGGIKDGVGDVVGGIGDAAGSLGNALKGLGEDAWGWSTGMLMMGAGEAVGKAWDMLVGPMLKKGFIGSNALGGGKENVVSEGMKKVPDKWKQALIALIQSKEVTGGVGFVPFRAWKAGDEQRSSYKGHTFNKRTIEMIKKAEKIYGGGFNIAQGSYSGGVAASAGTHDGGGAIDCGPANQSVVGSLRASGFAAWLRGAPFSPHVHGIAVGDPTVSAGAAAQVRAFNEGKDGLAGNGPDNYVPPARFMKYITAGGGGGAGVERWRTLAAKALQMAGLSASQLPKFMALMAAESGGNPTAINLWDSNAKQGYDMASKGLMQVIGPTFRAYHVAGTSSNIFDPLANMAASAKYIKARYGGQVPGSPYANGGIAGKGLIRVGERGPELLDLGTTSRVYNNKESNAIARNATASGTGASVHVEVGGITIQGDGVSQQDANNIATQLRRAIEAGVGRHG